MILAHRVLKIALMNLFVLCQPTNAAARRLCRPAHRHLSQVCIMFANRPFYRYGCHIEFVRFMWDAQGALAQYSRALFGQKENFTVYLFREKGDHY